MEERSCSRVIMSEWVKVPHQWPFGNWISGARSWGGHAVMMLKPDGSLSITPLFSRMAEAVLGTDIAFRIARRGG